MRGYISHVSAALEWEIPCIEAVLGDKTIETVLTHITVSSCNERYRVKNKKIRLSTIPLPSGAVTVRNGKKVASPELLFLEMARDLSIHQLILLGLQLCSHSPGNPSEAITSTQKLNRFLAKTSGHHGRRKALQAMRYVADGSGSIMESLAYMMLVLPHTLGGYGLGGVVFNHEVKLKDEARIRLGQKRCFVDLYYKQAKVGVEYESFKFHSSPSEQGKDSVRSAILEKQGIEIMHLSTIQLYDPDAFRDFAINLSRHLNKRIYIRAKKFGKMHALLRTLLPKSIEKEDWIDIQDFDADTAGFDVDTAGFDTNTAEFDGQYL
jgi:hypothetical protein